jgi:hypothetical protein
MKPKFKFAAILILAAALSSPAQAQELYSIDIRLIRVVDQTGRIQDSVIRSLLEDSVAVVDEVAIRRIRLSQESPFTNTKPFRYVDYPADGETMVHATKDVGTTGTVHVKPVDDRRVDVSLKYIFTERGVPRIQRRNTAQVVVHSFHSLNYTLSFKTEIGAWHFHQIPGRGDMDLNIIAFRIFESGEGRSLE